MEDEEPASSPCSPQPGPSREATQDDDNEEDTHYYVEGSIGAWPGAPPYFPGEWILCLWPDGNVYCGLIVEADNEAEQCLIRYSEELEKWSSYRKIKRFCADVMGLADKRTKVFDPEDIARQLEEGKSLSDIEIKDEYLIDDEEEEPAKPQEEEIKEKVDDAPLKVKKSSGNKRTRGRVLKRVHLDNVSSADDADDFRDSDYVGSSSVSEAKKRKRKRKLRAHCDDFRRKRTFKRSQSSPAAIPSKIRKLEPPSEAILEARKELPYDFDTLTWDANNLRNIQERYCYCGESGDWYKRMIQCQKCLQWFHQECLRKSIHHPLMLGDLFFDLICAICSNSSEEQLERLDLSWPEALHLVLFNLTMINRKRYHDIDTAILPFFKRKLPCMQGPLGQLKSSRLDQSFILHLLTSHKNRFKCGSESKKRSSFWGLRKVCPPSVPGKFGLQGVNCKEAVINYKCKLVKEGQTSMFQGGCARKSAKPVNSKYPFANRRSAKGCGKRRKKSVVRKTSKEILDELIPYPESFSGPNNPFRFPGVAEKDSSKSKSSSMDDEKNNCQPFLGDTSLNGVEWKLPKEGRKYRMWKRSFQSHQDSSKESSLVKSQSKTAGYLHSSEQDLLNPGLKKCVNSVFGSQSRILKGESFAVLAKRISSDGDIQECINDLKLF